MAHLLSVIAVDLLGSSHMDATSLSFRFENGVLYARFVYKTPLSVGSVKLLRFENYYIT